jgi:von Willebrand factor type A domain
MIKRKEKLIKPNRTDSELSGTSSIKSFSSYRSNATENMKKNNRLRFLAAGLLILSIASFSAIVSIIAWFAPVSRPVITIVSESYATNLLVPHNLPSINSATKLAELIESSKTNPLLSNFSNPNQQGELIVERLDTLIPSIRDLKRSSNSTKHYFFYISAHGLVDENGPYLLKDWMADRTEGLSQPEEKDKVRVMDLLKNIVEIANGLPIAVIFNCEQNNSFKDLGIWGNQFSESIIQMDQWIETQPNLSVILTTGKSEINCIDSKVSESLYGRILRETMSNQTELGRTFNLFQLHNSVTKKVTKEAAERFGISQNPVLLPAGRSGVTRASHINFISINAESNGNSSLLSRQEITIWKERLGISSDSYQGITSENLNRQDLLPKSISNIWDDFGKINQITPHPVSFKPDAWSIYKAAVLRYEELILNNSYQSANRLKKEIDRLKLKLEDAKPLFPLIFEPSIAFSEFHLKKESRKVPQWLVTEFDSQWKKQVVDVDKILIGISEKYEKTKIESSSLKLTQPPTQNSAVNPASKEEPAKAGNVKESAGLNGEKPADSKTETKSGTNESSVSAKANNNNQKESELGNNSKAEVKSSNTPGTSGSLTADAKAASGINKSQSVQTEKTEESKTTDNEEIQKKISSELRYWLLTLIVEKIQSEATKNLDQARLWLNRIIPDKGLYPLELHIIALASKDFGRVGLDDFRPIGKDSVYNFVDVVSYTERAFAGLSDNKESRSNYFNHTYFWIKPWFDVAEKEFLDGWDHIFSRDDVLRNKGFLMQRQTILKYKEILARSGAIQRCLETYYLSLERLPEITYWAVKSQLIDQNNDYIKSNDLFDQIMQAWSEIRSISKLLENEKKYDLSVQERSLIINELSTKSDKLANLLELLENQFTMFSRRLISFAESRDVDSKFNHLIDLTLRVSPKNIELRQALLKVRFSIIRREGIKTTEQNGNDVATIHSELSDYLCQKMQELQFDLGENLNEISKYKLTDFNKMQERLNISTYNSLYAIRQLQMKMNTMENDFQQVVSEIDTAKSWSLDRFRRILPLCMIHDTNDKFVTKVQRLLTSEHLRIFARRIWNAHWGAINETSKPYYQEVSFLLNEEASRILDNDPVSESMNKSFSAFLQSPPLPEVNVPQNVEFVGDSQMFIPVDVDTGNQFQFPSGFSAILVQPSNDLELTQNSRSDATMQVDQSDSKRLFFIDKTLNNKESIDIVPSTKKTKLNLGFLFRGNYIEKETSVNIRHIPDWREFKSVPPQGGSLALRADPAIISRIGQSGGNVCFVLDCSGSMGVQMGQVWNPNVKYAKAVECLLKTISSLPDQTNVSIWVFGEAVGTLKSAEPSATIRQVLPFTKWNSSNPNMLDRIRQLVAYPSCEPWNKSPIIEAMQMAKDKLVNETGTKAMIVITDGQDNVFGQNNASNNQSGKSSSELKNKNISTQIRSIFAQTDISVNVIGYKLPDIEMDAVAQQFSVVRDLGVPGIFTMVDDDNEFIRTLLAILRKKVVYRFESINSNKIRSENVDGIEIQPVGTSIQWANPVMEQDIYRLWLNSGDRIESRTFIQDGRRELFKLVEDNSLKGFSIIRDSWINTEFPWRPQVLSQGWTLSWIGSRLNGNHLEMLMALEKLSGTENNMLDNPMISPEPADVNFFIQTPDRNSTNLKGMIRRLWNYPSTVWKLTIFDWKSTPITPSIQMTIEPGRKFDPILTLLAGKDFIDAEELENRTFTTTNSKLTVEKFKKEMRWVPDLNNSGMINKPCWIIRTKINGPDLFRTDLEFDQDQNLNTEYRYFNASGICETVFWPESDKVKLDELKIPKRVSIRMGLNGQLKTPGNTVRLNLENRNLMPSEKDPWPLPVELSNDSAQTSGLKSMSNSLPSALGPAPPIPTTSSP